MRVYASSASAKADALKGFVCAISRNSDRRVRELWMARIEIALRISIPLFMGLFIAFLLALSFTQTRNQYERHTEEMGEEIDALAALIMATINVSSAHSGKNIDIPSEALIQNRQIVVSDRDGNIIAAFPPNGPFSAAAEELLSKAKQKHINFMQSLDSHVLQLTSKQGEKALIAARALNEPYGQVAIIHPLPPLFNGWTLATFSGGAALIAACVIIAFLGIVYIWQARRAQQTMQISVGLRSRVDLALSRGHCGLWDWDVTRQRIYGSSSMYELIGLSPQGDYMRPDDIVGLIHPDDGEFSFLAEQLEDLSISVLEREFRIRHASGHWLWIRIRAERIHDANANEIHFVGVAFDVSREHILAQHNATADMRLRDAIETVSEAFVLWDADNRLVMCNSKFEMLHHLPPEFAKPGTSYQQVMSKGSLSEVQNQISLLERAQWGERSYEAQLTDGRWLQVNERRTNDGGYVSVGTDISKLKENQARLIDSEHRLTLTVADLRRSRLVLEMQAQQLADLAEKYFEQKAQAELANMAKSEFLANMSHELRTPLNHIIGFAEVMAEQTFGPLGHANYLDYSRNIANSGTNLLAVISDILDIACLESGRFRIQRQSLRLNETINTAMTEVQDIVQGKNISLRLEAPEELHLRADAKCLHRITSILLRNAVKFTPEGGHISLKATKAENGIHLDVEDTGIGIGPTDLKRIARPFEQRSALIEDGMRGSGLGLAIAIGLIELHQGKLTIQSTLGRGTRVRVFLPDVPMAALPLLRHATAA